MVEGNSSGLDKCVDVAPALTVQTVSFILQVCNIKTAHKGTIESYQNTIFIPQTSAVVIIAQRRRRP